MTKKIQNTCTHGHRFSKSSDFPVCPICWPDYHKRKHRNDFPAKLAAPALRALLNANIKNLKHLTKWSEKQLSGLHGISPHALGQLKLAMRKQGLNFQKTDPQKFSTLNLHDNSKLTKKAELLKGYLIKYHANGKTVWSKGKIKVGKPHGYWEWFRIDGTIKRSGHFATGVPVGEWITYDREGKVYKISQK